ncbi:hypothetical protein [Roseovarius dicentrarchi]|uniref:hypothetical protein n=1 Tax=Roseovarius dicentrarchi TaxID=2250573 RepID=UPI001396748C|nr:hypothetical protein [Roseovarius dicentrarchi]
MSHTPKPQRRWMTTALQSSAQPMPALPFKRGQRAITARTAQTAAKLQRRA